MTPGEKYSVKLADSEIESYKETFRMFDKVPRNIIWLGDNLYYFISGWWRHSVHQGARGSHEVRDSIGISEVPADFPFIKTPVLAVLFKLAYFWWRWPLFELFLGLFKNFLEFVFCFSQLESNCKLFGYSVNFIFAKIYGKPCQSSFRAEEQRKKINTIQL